MEGLIVFVAALSAALASAVPSHLPVDLQHMKHATFSQLIHHEDPKLGCFKQRYW
jgi:hypothetical protein